MASPRCRWVVVVAAVAVILGMSACTGNGSPAPPVPVRATLDTVDAWRHGWEPAAVRFWDAVGQWQKAGGTPSDPASEGAEATASSAASGIVAAATGWKQALPAADLPGDVTARAAVLSDRLAVVIDTWRGIEACGGDQRCVAALLAEAKIDMADLRGAQFDLRPG